MKKLAFIELVLQPGSEKNPDPDRLFTTRTRIGGASQNPDPDWRAHIQVRCMEENFQFFTIILLKFCAPSARWFLRYLGWKCHILSDFSCAIDQLMFMRTSIPALWMICNVCTQRLEFMVRSCELQGKMRGLVLFSNSMMALLWHNFCVRVVNVEFHYLFIW